MMLRSKKNLLWLEHNQEPSEECTFNYRKQILKQNIVDGKEYTTLYPILKLSTSLVLVSIIYFYMDNSAWFVFKIFLCKVLNF